MKQRIVINVPMREEESRKKVMKLASEIKGVSKVEVVKERNHLVVVGEDIDSVKLVNSLRKKFCFANILTIHNHNATTITTTTFDDEVRRRSDNEEDQRWPTQIHYGYPTRTTYDQPGYYAAYPVYDPNPPTPCSIM
ncbi:uncharacterized protein LOC130986118 [Salvia miltiorrhiza]|uniref:uncharacterized protein LOC130986118 n=1 Tax=Salvia miltiorrhiza TaxID=226208 RepID=UPI0025AD052B|nr:uncharacterized protein LOC130986118 [Salvia miltiorrhiza]